MLETEPQTTDVEAKKHRYKVDSGKIFLPIAAWVARIDQEKQKGLNAKKRIFSFFAYAHSTAYVRIAEPTRMVDGLTIAIIEKKENQKLFNTAGILCAEHL